jgi:quercetin dioxygenase-like cupin family protein
MKQLQSKKWSIAILALVLLVLASMLLTQSASATPFRNLHPTTIAFGKLAEEVRAKLKVGESGFTDGTDVKNIQIVQYILDPDGSFGWHTHTGPVWVIVTSGTLSIYDGNDPTCTPHIYAEGSAFLDSGGDTHLGINETNEPVEIYATFMLPEKGTPRVDAENPSPCNKY